MNLGLKNKTALITGCSAGIGESIAINFSKNKTKCMLISRNRLKLVKLKKKLDKNISGNSIFDFDLTDDARLYSFLKKINLKNCPDFIIHNVGGTLGKKPPTSDYKDWLSVINFNVGIAIKINNILIPFLKKKKFGRIVHISSISGIALRGSSPYACSKTLLNSYSTTLARFLAKDNIVVSAIMPGSIIAKGTHWDNIRKANPEMMKDFLRHHHATGRLGLASEISPWVMFLCSSYATPFVTGANINIDGGTM